MKTIFAALLAGLVWLPAATAGAEEADVEEIVRTIDDLYRSRSSYAEMEMRVVNPNWQRTLRMNVWSEGMQKTFIRVLAPQREKGVGTLRLGNEMWNYLPNANKVIKIPPSMMMNSWMGSDFTNDDLVRESSLREDYTYRLVTPPDAEKGLLYISFVPKEDTPVVWGSIVAAVSETDYLPVWQRYYDEKGTLVRVLRFSEPRTFDGRRIPTVMEMIPQTKKGHQTVVRYQNIRFNIPLEQGIFTLRNLRSGE